ncbi:unannotated protein [freshwater metagenome]|uniref:Unannotated protein n=1 Tax=freshwater metagenome TaxID=449393 RepID=A0A6J7M539_9ZZZZ
MIAEIFGIPPADCTPTYKAPVNSINNSAALAEATSANAGSTPRSNLRDASEERM